ncbi:cytochrome P450 [Aspergillus fijiensis CBS 313.89]|uniref:Cytochrome P450 n=1 Tax=Aspergillus fijiensis CBS 313.89 TaxID=1448319 RepID=A0A8G1RML4_9EURO|nr:cytochrome P450 [Aspergillus fijiensis CBS 313.89]RAK76852.1 cytochrome P450 [Aspergillus fijiensis CBS 313.89]
MSNIFLTFLFAGSIFLARWIWSSIQARGRWRQSGIPQPLGHPIFGAKSQLGPNPGRRLEELGLTQGELFHIRFGFEDFVYVNSREAVREIFDRQSAKTSSKGPWRGATPIVSGGRIAIMPYNTHWRRLRTILHQLLHPNVARSFRPSQEFEATQLVSDLLQSGGEEVVCKEQAHRMSLSVILTSTYGRRVASMDDPICHRVDKIMEDFSQATAPGAFITDLIPQLDRLPTWLQWWRARALKFHERQHSLWMGLWQELRQKVLEGSAPTCFAKHFMETETQRYGIDESQAAFLAGTLIEAGSDTSASALNIAILYLAANPAVLHQAHAEVSRVVGGDTRSPSFDDIDRLPFIHACIHEVARIRPLTRFGTAHYTTAEVQYKQARIPAGCFVVINQPAIHHDPASYPDPHEFQPARYLKSSSWAPSSSYPSASDKAKDKSHLNFGAGRRICPGLHVAENSLFIVLAKLVWLFDILPARDEAGRHPLPVDVSDDGFEDGANTVPKPFRVRFVPRSAARAERMRQEWEEAKRVGFVIRDVKVDLDGVVVG